MALVQHSELRWGYAININSIPGDNGVRLTSWRFWSTGGRRFAANLT